ncbi:efflux RND transporter permease subunit [Maricurvus nonylphenolicus]|uniref:efflux RND transporter permease subunit n=1 Tax=Maricurvus nonylphenolicus TaxID=1008307 RepID=UPI0036F27ECB
MNVAEYSIQKKTVTMVMTVLMLVGGIMAFNGLSRLEDPEFTIKDALVVTQYPGATPAEVELEVTDLIETEIQRLGQVKEIQSISKAGLSTITVTMKDKYDKDSLPAVWEQLRRKIHDVTGKLPPGAQQPVVIDDFGDVFGVMFALTGDGYTNKELYEYAKFLRRELLLVKDVAKVDLWGVQQEAIYVEFSRAQMSLLGISQNQIYQALEKQNAVVPAGSVQVGRDYVRIDSTGSIHAVADIENLILRGNEGASSLIYLRDVAKVSREYVTPPSNVLHFNGETSIALSISTVSGGNVVTMGAGVMERLAELQRQVPVGLEAHTIIMQSEAVTKAIDNFVTSLLQAIAIVIVVLLLFMGVRSGLIIGVVLLITVVATFIIMDMEAVALERISLGALVIALGMLVDNAIVVTEGMLIRIKQGEDRLQSAKTVVSQTMWPLLGATVIAILAFAAIGLSDDSTGEFCRSLFQVMLFSLMLSWVTAITLTPLLCYWFIQGPEAGQSQSSTEDAYRGAFFVAYRTFLSACLHHRWPTIGVALLLLVSAIYGFSTLKGSFFPKSTMPNFMVHYWLPEGADIRNTAADINAIEDFILEDERTKSVASFIGQGAPRFILTYTPEKANSSYGMLLVEVNDYLDIDSLMAKIRMHLAEHYPDAEPKLQRFNLGPSPDSSVEVRFSGPDPRELRRLSEEAKAILMAEGGTAVRDNWRQRVKVVRPVYADQQAKSAGISREDLNRALETNFTGTTVGLYREYDDLIPIISRAPVVERQDVAQIGNIQVWSPATNNMIPIRQVVSSFETRWEDAQIHRLNRKRTITAGGEPPLGELPSEMFARIRPQIEAIELPVGYDMEWGGEYESSTDAQTALAGGIPGSVVMMILITVILFNTVKHPLIIWLTVPLAVIGVAAGLLATGEPFGFMPLLGFLSLMGMLIKNAIVLIDQINLDLAEGKKPFVAVLDAAVSRCRPVLMAAGTTVLGMIPLLTDDFFVGMAVTIMAGLSFASILTLIVVPVLYVILYRVPAMQEAK